MINQAAKDIFTTHYKVDTGYLLYCDMSDDGFVAAEVRKNRGQFSVCVLTNFFGEWKPAHKYERAFSNPIAAQAYATNMIENTEVFL